MPNTFSSEHVTLCPPGANSPRMHWAYLPLMFTPARMTSSTRSSWLATTGALCMICFLTIKLSSTPAMIGSKGSPVATSKPTTLPFSNSSCSLMHTSWASYPEFSASTLATPSNASANASMPSLARPSTVLRVTLRKWCAAATSNAPAPGNTQLSSRVFFTARKPSLTASLICAMTWSLCPLSRMVTDCGFCTSSTNVYFSSPSTCSYTWPALPRASGTSSSTELMANPPHAACRRSMLRFLARLSPMMPSLASMSKEMGSMPFWLITTKPLSGELPHTLRLRSMILRTRSSVTSRSAATSLSRCSALL
mmetsp:Transcript_351/g.873  ORF Transcript_351/g.873 Transcript_351/m.873 type:complete len:309 (-) Transcript_351:889-1815(-)